MGAAIKSLSCETLPVPAPAAGQVRVKVQYAAVNPIDWKLMSGGLDGVCPCSFPYTPGFDISGVVDAVGDDVSDLAAGDAVVADLGLVETCCNPPPAGLLNPWHSMYGSHEIFICPHRIDICPHSIDICPHGFRNVLMGSKYL